MLRQMLVICLYLFNIQSAIARGSKATTDAASTKKCLLDTTKWEKDVEPEQSIKKGGSGQSQATI
jgi:hypothetical protein